VKAQECCAKAQEMAKYAKVMFLKEFGAKG
jgi:hypothetical protein